MAALRSFFSILSFSSVFLLNLTSFSTASNEDRKVYVVYMGSLPSHGDYMPLSHHQNMLQEALGTSLVENLMVRNFKRSFNGFVARLTEAEREKLAAMEGVVSIFPRKQLELQTTRSWDFMGFNDKVKHDINVESNMIVGMFDSGIWPESESFSDKGFGPPPEKWKGSCNGGQNFTCNNKIIGARYYTALGTEETARDSHGHGTHTASTAAGNLVKGTSFYGLAKGTARGGVPSARIAAYKVCDEGCSSDAILAAFDDAIADGVDIISISLGSGSASPFEDDPIAIGAFHAMQKGILTVNSAGNNGPDPGTVSSLAPWILTVAASNTDRRFIDKVVLGNGKTLTGQSLNSFNLNGTKFPLVYGKDVSSLCSSQSAGACEVGCIDHKLVKGKILLCDEFSGSKEAYSAGAIGSILKNSEFPDVAYVLPLPASALAIADYESVRTYMNSTKNPVATILKSETVRNMAAPVVVSFSSRGPNMIARDILKPDITAPGVDILAAYSPIPTASANEDDPRHVKYNVLSGTSMSCPHVAGVAAYLKSIHLDWTPSVIKSAIMTTAWPMNNSVNSDGEFAYGSGHVDPVKAADPGLVYEASKDDYITMLCAMNYTKETLKIISGDNSTCPNGSNESLVRNLNYPSMAAKVTSVGPFEFTFNRTVTNVGTSNSVYKANVIAGSQVRVKVVPEILSFESLNQKKTFAVTVSGKGFGSVGSVSASLVWTDSIHSVRSPIVVYQM